MKFLKNLFKTKKEIKPVPESQEVSISTEEKFVAIGKPNGHQEKEHKVLNSSNIVSLTDKKRNELIEQFANDNNWFDKSESNMSDPVLKKAASLIVKHQSGSTSLIQKEFNLGYNRAGRIIDSLEILGIVGPPNGGTPREVRIKTEEELKYFFTYVCILNQGEIERFRQENRVVIEARRIEIKQLALEAQISFEKDTIRKSLLEQERKKNLQREVYKELIDEGLINRQVIGEDSVRERIPQHIMDKVWNRDSGKCVKCSSQEKLEFDHIIPFSKGGANTYRNLQILCEKCNIEKSNNIG